MKQDLVKEENHETDSCHARVHIKDKLKDSVRENIHEALTLYLFSCTIYVLVGKQRKLFTLFYFCVLNVILKILIFLF
jgi:hypothetical protein